MTDKQIVTLIMAAPFLALCFAWLLAEAFRIAAQLRAERVTIHVRATTKRGR